MNRRTDFWKHCGQTVFDVAIIGGGITGAALYHQLCERGYKVLLLDKGDFACGSSQSSGMMVWGGVLYLRRFDIASVLRFSHARDQLLRDYPALATPEFFRYLPPSRNTLWRYLVLSSLYAYWLFGCFNRKPPMMESSFEEQSLLDPDRLSYALKYEEGFLKDSDSRFVLQWITPHQSFDQVPLNYCGVDSGAFNESRRRWSIHLKDNLSGEKTIAMTNCVVNCAGVWTDEVNRRFGIETPFRHVLSKGVYLSFSRPKEHRKPLAFEMGEHGDVLTYVPWGPISLWGPTETLVSSIDEGFSVTPNDIRFLLHHAARRLQIPISFQDVVSLRCGVRPLAVRKSYHRRRYPLTLSRKHHIFTDPNLPWISFFGGKLTNCMSIAHAIERKIIRMIGLSKPGRRSIMERPKPLERTSFPGLSVALPSPSWCRRYEFCQTLEDYLRRRTNIAQWIPREGLGRKNENLPQLFRIALDLYENDSSTAWKATNQYRQQVEREFDSVLSQAV